MMCSIEVMGSPRRKRHTTMPARPFAANTTLVLIANAIILASSLPLLGNAQVVTQEEGGGTFVKVDGLDIEFDSHGVWTKIYSTYNHPVDFPDRRGIKKAQVIAEEKGKAQLLRFLQQEIVSERLVSEVETSTQTATHSKGTANPELSSESQRQIVDSVKEFTRSFSQGTLKGIAIIETGYNSENEEAWVKLGFSRATMAAADAIKKGMRTSGSMSGGNSTTPKATGSATIDVKRQASEDRSGRVLPGSDKK